MNFPEDRFIAATAGLFGSGEEDAPQSQLLQGRQRVSQETHNLPYAGSNPAPASNLTATQRLAEQRRIKDRQS